MEHIDLSKYEGKEVVCELAKSDCNSSNVLKGVVTKMGVYEVGGFTHQISGWYFRRNGEGYSLPDITKITEVIHTPGIAQRYPNINLRAFTGQTCLIKFNSGCIIVYKISSPVTGVWEIGPDKRIMQDGNTLGSAYIKEIYGEGAYEIKTKETFDEPPDKELEKIKKEVNNLSKEQVEKLLQHLKK